MNNNVSNYPSLTGVRYYLLQCLMICLLQFEIYVHFFFCPVKNNLYPKWAIAVQPYWQNQGWLSFSNEISSKPDGTLICRIFYLKNFLSLEFLVKSLYWGWLVTWLTKPFLINSRFFANILVLSLRDGSLGNLHYGHGGILIRPEKLIFISELPSPR